jgi:hypothetical protein
MYSWTPAGAWKNGILHAYIYIRYRKSGHSKIILEEDDTIGKGGKIILPDREIVISYKPHIRPIADDVKELWDECFESSIFNKGGMGEKYLDHILISAHNGFEQKIWDRDFMRSDKIKIIGDSGGAQLKGGSSDFVDPYRVIDWHNHVVDIGATLDVPPRPVDHGDNRIIRALAEVQKRNNRIFLDNKRQDLKLFNIVHGYTLQQSRDWANHVAEDGFYGWAAGADNYGSDLANFRNLLVAILEQPRVSHYHFFGVSGGQRMPAVAWIGKYVDRITADSTVYLQGTNKMMYWLTPDMKLKQVNVGDASDLYRDHLSPLPCNCEMCSRLQYWQTYSLPSKFGVSFMLAWHNLAVIAKQSKYWNALAQQLDYNSFMRVVVRTYGEGSAAAQRIQYVERAFQDGLDKTDSNYSVKDLGEQPVRAGRMRQLFEQPKEDKKKKNMLNLPDRESIVEKVLPRYLSAQEIADFGINV